MSDLDSVLEDHKKVGDAPSLEDLEREAKMRRITLEERLNEEAQVWYKALQGRSVYLMRNPALMAAQLERHISGNTVRREPPKFQFNLGDRRGSTKKDNVTWLTQPKEETVW